MPYTLPKLPYATDALEPHVDARTMEIHHGKHHQAYCDNVNKALAGTPWAEKPIEDVIKNLHQIPEDRRAAVRNHGGGYLNHCLFWPMLSPKGGGEPTGKVAKAIEASFGSFADFRVKFSDAAVKHFGSGWAWLVAEGNTLKVMSLPNQDSPLTSGLNPILTLDLWEHAYYLKYQNRRAEFVEAFWNVVNWEEVERRLEEAM
ncbi:MAG: superoxide dismutase [Candidatus Peribacteraceae bacterium]|nr:superoxide dismutase [Candidatus Peribacteraceae bacterium]